MWKQVYSFALLRKRFTERRRGHVIRDYSDYFYAGEAHVPRTRKIISKRQSGTVEYVYKIESYEVDVKFSDELFAIPKTILFDIRQQRKVQLPKKTEKGKSVVTPTRGCTHLHHTLESGTDLKTGEEEHRSWIEMIVKSRASNHSIPETHPQPLCQAIRQTIRQPFRQLGLQRVHFAIRELLEAL